MKNTTLKISVVTTLYNLENYIEKCLDSIFAQTYKNLEVIVVNDCSTDKSMDIVNKYIDDRLIVINHDVNKGAGWARRTGIEHATGDYVITVDGDDWLSPDFIEKLVDTAIETGSDIVSGGITIVYDNDAYEEVKRFYPRTSTGFQKILDYGAKKIIFLNNKLVRRSMYEKTPYCTRRYCEDTPVILPLLYWANSVSYADTQGYYYLQHSKSLCHKVTTFDQHLYKALCSIECIKFFADKEPDYQNVISRIELGGYLKSIKTQMTPELQDKYSQELAELAVYMLDIFIKD